jgi:hypothetical protein
VKNIQRDEGRKVDKVAEEGEEKSFELLCEKLLFVVEREGSKGEEEASVVELSLLLLLVVS